MFLKIRTFFSSRSFRENLRYESKSFNPTCVSTPPTIFVPAFFTPHLTVVVVVLAVVVVVAFDVVAVVVVVDDVFGVVVVVVVTLEQRIL